MRAYAAALRAEAEADFALVVEIKRRGGGPNTPLRDVFTESEMAQMPRWLTRPAKPG